MLFKKEESIKIIKESLKYEYKSVTDVLQYDLLFDALYEQIKFTIDKGFNLNECAFLAKLFNQLLDYIKR